MERSQYADEDEVALVDHLLTAEREKRLKRRDKRIQRARAAIVALRRCGYLYPDEEMR
jgi:hypothetical protein